MASRLIDFCEQANPAVLGELRRTKRFENARRIHNGLTSNPEKRMLIWMAKRTPRWIDADHLTMLGFLAQVMAGASYALARWHRYWLLAVIGFLALNWLGDSLDGTIARVREQLRPRYGFYVDHIADSFGGLALMAGLALSGYMHPAVAIGLLVAFLLLSIQSYLATYTLGEFQLSFWNFGPTELRILLAVGNVALLYRPFIFHGHYRLFDVGGGVGLIGMSAMLIFFTARNTRRLYLEERIGEERNLQKRVR
ncbi:MAG TPA: CDP-alcohol phosphatidyltransferase family protein [Terriglobales bacterium]|nr:CDP-alcohol phosphatidyltransferase family protein [Terriglobales bacterium]